MILSPRAIEELKALYQAEFGDALSDAEAQEMGLRLLRVFDLLLRAPSVPSHAPLVPHRPVDRDGGSLMLKA